MQLWKLVWSCEKLFRDQIRGPKQFENEIVSHTTESSLFGLKLHVLVYFVYKTSLIIWLMFDVDSCWNKLLVKILQASSPFQTLATIIGCYPSSLSTKFNEIWDMRSVYIMSRKVRLCWLLFLLNSIISVRARSSWSLFLRCVLKRLLIFIFIVFWLFFLRFSSILSFCVDLIEDLSFKICLRSFAISIGTTSSFLGYYLLESTFRCSCFQALATPTFVRITDEAS